MTIYSLSAMDNDPKRGHLGFAYTITEGAEDCRFKGNPRPNWQPMLFQWVLKPNQKRKNLAINDFVSVVGAGVSLVVSERAKTVLQAALGEDAEYLPIKIRGEEPDAWYLFNVIHKVENAVSAEKSHYLELPTGMRVLKHPVFVESDIPDNRIFVYPNSYNTAVVKGEFLKELVTDHKLTGLQFHPCETIESGPLSKSAVG